MNTKGIGPLLVLGGGLMMAISLLYGAQNPHGQGERHSEHPKANTLSTPEPLSVEHHELHEELLKGTKETGEVGKAAKTVAELLHPHFVKEEEYALPLLGLLVLVSKGNVAPNAKEAIAMSGKLKADLPNMLNEHRQIVAALDVLAKAARKAGKAEYVRFSEKLKLHAETEEQVLYPAAILVGEYLKLRASK